MTDPIATGCRKPEKISAKCIVELSLWISGKACYRQARPSVPGGNYAGRGAPRNSEKPAEKKLVQHVLPVEDQIDGDRNSVASGTDSQDALAVRQDGKNIHAGWEDHELFRG